MANKKPKSKAKSKMNLNRQEDVFNLVQMTNALIRRSDIARGLGKQYAGQRDLYEILGYEKDPRYENFRNSYMRDGLATRIVDTISDETWREHPVLIEGEGKRIDEDDNPSDLQIQFEALAQKHDLWTVFNDVDAYCGISRFSLILLGLPGRMEDPAQSGPLLYVSAHDEGDAEIDEASIVTKADDPRFGLPNFYNVVVDEKTQAKKRVHWSRIIHVKEGRTKSRIYGVPRLLPMLNRLYDLEKVVGAGSEAFYQLIHRGFIMSAKDDATMPEEGSKEEEKLRERMDEYFLGIRKYLLANNVDVKDMGGRPVDSDQQFKSIVSYLAGTSHIPQRILIGSEAGNLASTQDEYNLFSFIVARQKQFAEPRILRAFVDRVAQLGILNVPPKYTVDWPSLFQLTDKEQMEVATAAANAINTATGGAPESMMDGDEFAKRYLKYKKEYPDPVEVLEKKSIADDPSKVNPEPSMPDNTTQQFTWQVPEILDLDRVRMALSANSGIKLNEYDNSAMICFDIPDAIKSEIVGKFHFIAQELIDNLHITLVYLGDNRTIDLGRVEMALNEFRQIQKPIKGKFGGVARFKAENGDKEPFVFTFDSPDMPEFYMNLIESLERNGVPYHKEHGFTPHMTVAYLDRDKNSPIQNIDEPIEVNFHEVYYVSGKQWHDVRLNKLEGVDMAHMVKVLSEPTVVTHGGVGSGNKGHAGRPGKVGGSAKEGEGSIGQDDPFDRKGPMFHAEWYEKDVEPELSEEEKEAIRKYGDGKFRDMNKTLRDDDPLDTYGDDVAKNIEDLNAVVERESAPENFAVFRGTRLTSTNVGEGRYEFSDSKQALISNLNKKFEDPNFEMYFFDKGFQSMSLSPQKAFDFAQESKANIGPRHYLRFNVEVAKGTKCFPLLNPESEYSDEFEVVFAPETNFIVTRVNRKRAINDANSFVYDIYMESVP